MVSPNPFAYDLRSRTVESRDYRWFMEAVAVAQFGEHERVRVGAVVSYGKNIKAGCNTMRNPVGNVPYPYATVHAEINALQQVPYDRRRGATIYVARLGALDEPLPSFPCDNCMGEIRRYGFKEIVYFDGNTIVKVRI